jgi:hypothetical protein
MCISMIEVLHIHAFSKAEERSKRKLTHGGTAESRRVGCALDANAQDVDARGVDIDDLAKVAEAGAFVSLGIEGANSDSVRRAGGARVAGVLGLVAGGHDGHDSRVDEGLDGVVDGVGLAASQGHVHDGLALQVLGCHVTLNEVEALEHVRVGPASVGAQNLDALQLHVLGYAEGRAANGAGDVRAVAVLVGILFCPVSFSSHIRYVQPEFALCGFIYLGRTYGRALDSVKG